MKRRDIQDIGTERDDRGRQKSPDEQAPQAPGPEVRQLIQVLAQVCYDG